MFLAVARRKCHPLLPSAGRRQQKMPTGKHCLIGPVLHGKVFPALLLNLALFGAPGSLQYCSVSWGPRPFFFSRTIRTTSCSVGKMDSLSAPTAPAFSDPDFFVHRQVLKQLLHAARPPDLKALYVRQLCKAKMLIRWQAPKIAAAIQYPVLLTSACYQSQTRPDCASVT